MPVSKTGRRNAQDLTTDDTGVKALADTRQLNREAAEQAAAAPPIVVQTDPVLNSPLSISALVLAILATTYALYVGKDVVLPIMLAVVLKLLLQPTWTFSAIDFACLRHLLHCYLIICLFVFIATVLFAISGPASAWISKLPEVLPLLNKSSGFSENPSTTCKACSKN